VLCGKLPATDGVARAAGSPQRNIWARFKGDAADSREIN
jgi:hypothetical protein